VPCVTQQNRDDDVEAPERMRPVGSPRRSAVYDCRAAPGLRESWGEDCLLGRVLVMRSSVFSQRILPRVVLLGAAMAAVAPMRQALAQSGAAATTPANPFAPDNTKRVPVSKAVFGDVGVIVNARDDGFIEVAAAGQEKPILLQFRTQAARAWVDSTLRMLKARPKKSDTPRTFRSDIPEFGTNGTMALTRKLTAGQSEYALFFSDKPTGGFTAPIEASEADVFVAIIRKAVAQSAKMLDKPDTTARADSTPPPAPKKKRPAAKKPASPPAQTPAQPTPPAATQPKPAPVKPNPANPAKPTP
jgi:hypothetical protein